MIKFDTGLKHLRGLYRNSSTSSG